MNIMDCGEPMNEILRVCDMNSWVAWQVQGFSALETTQIIMFFCFIFALIIAGIIIYGSIQEIRKAEKEAKKK